MSKQAHRSQRLAARTRETSVQTSRPDRRILAVLGGVGVLLAAGLVVAAITFAAVNTGNSTGLPAGTQVFPENDHTHVTGTVNYDHNPPAGGPHNPVQLNCGVYTEQVPNENAVHSLEHGAVWITYQPTLPADQVAQLQQLAVSNYVGTERYVILSPYLNLPSPVVVSAWGAQLSLQTASDPRLVQFIHHFAGGAQGGEPGGPCTGGVGTPVE
jgi:hypothetical protein